MSKYDTPCKNCIFAIYNGITQTSCKLNKINLFHKHGIHILEAYDAEKEFYVVRNKRCMWFRNRLWKYACQDRTEQMRQLNKEIEIKYQVIIFANDNIEDIKYTISSILKQDILPKHVTIVRKPELTISPTELINLVQPHENKFGWRIENIVDPNTPEGSMIDYVLDVKHFQYYSVFRAGFHIPKDTFSTLNRLIIEELKPITILLANSTGNGLTVSYPLHKILQGHHDCGIEHKLYNNDVIKVNPKQVQSITEICPNFPK